VHPDLGKTCSSVASVQTSRAHGKFGPGEDFSRVCLRTDLEHVDWIERKLLDQLTQTAFTHPRIRRRRGYFRTRCRFGYVLALPRKIELRLACASEFVFDATINSG
jgi:hypothetical protein